MPTHPYYDPTNEFIQRHELHIDEAETWVELTNAEWPGEATKCLLYNKDTGEIDLMAGKMGTATVLFKGFLPDEAALESVIKWTKWSE